MRLLEGYNFRQDGEWQKLAWQTAHLMNSTGNYKNYITAEELLKPPTKKKTMARLKREYHQLKKRFKDLKPLPEDMKGMDIYQALGLKGKGADTRDDRERVEKARKDYRSLKKALGR
jgi:uncharacterized short protein YbdD (DUF466 family)